MNEQVIADTSFVVAVAVRTDNRHADCLAVYRQHPNIYLPQAALAEIAFMLRRAGGTAAVSHFVRNLPTSKYVSLAITDDDLWRTADLLEKYADTRLDFVDVTIAAIAERLNISRVLTLDRRDFQILRPRHVDHFEILP